MIKLCMYKGSRASEGFNLLKESLSEALGYNVVSLRPDTRASDNPNRMILNWGVVDTSRISNSLPSAMWLNQNIGLASDKAAFMRIARNPVGFFTNWQDTLAYLRDAGTRIYARRILNGHSGEGILIILRDTDPQAARVAEAGYDYVIVNSQGHPQNSNLPISILSRDLRQCRLFTIGVTGRRNEWRVHVFNGSPIFLQKKLRRAGLAGNTTSMIRNTNTGWVYTIAETNECPPGVIRNAIEAVQSSGITFGAVDIVETTANGLCRVLEVNTAPGLTAGGTALARYTTAISSYLEAINQGVPQVRESQPSATPYSPSEILRRLQSGNTLGTGQWPDAPIVGFSSVGGPLWQAVESLASNTSVAVATERTQAQGEF